MTSSTIPGVAELPAAISSSLSSMAITRGSEQAMQRSSVAIMQGTTSSKLGIGVSAERGTLRVDFDVGVRKVVGWWGNCMRRLFLGGC